MTPNNCANPYIINKNINNKIVNNKNYENFENNIKYSNINNCQELTKFMPEIREVQCQIENMTNSYNQNTMNKIMQLINNLINLFIITYINLKNSYDRLKQDYTSLEDNFNIQKNSMNIKIKNIEKRERETKMKLAELDIKYQEVISSNDSIQLCSVCMCEPISHIYVECGHYCICQNCVDQTKNFENNSKYNCPICRETGKVKKVFVS